MPTRHVRFPFHCIHFPSCGVSLSIPAPALAVNFQPVSPDELKMTSEPKAPGAPAIILFREVDRDDRGQTAHEDVYFRIKILTEEGRKYADIEIPFFKYEGSIVNIHARTIDPDGSIVNFNGKAFDKSIVKARGVQYLAKTFTMPDVQVGSILEYYYTDRPELKSSSSTRTGFSATNCSPRTHSSLSSHIPATMLHSAFAGPGTSCHPGLPAGTKRPIM